MTKKDTLIQVFCLLSVGLGVGLGFLLKFTGDVHKDIKEWIKMPGNILISILQMFSLPLIVTSVLSGITGLNTKMSKKIAIITGVYICVSTLYVTSYAMTLVLSLRPGVGVGYVTDEPDRSLQFSMQVVVMDLLRNMIPESFYQAFFEQYKTEIIYVSKDQIISEVPLNDSEMRLVGNYVSGANLPGLIITSFTIGILINKAGEKAKTTVKLIQHLNDAIKIMVHWFMWYLPFGVLFLIADSVLGVENWKDAFKLVKFAGVVCLAYVHFICFNFFAKLRSLLRRWQH